MSEFDFYFELSGRSGYEGPNDPSSEHFTSKALETSLARETIQNSLDAAASQDAPVVVEFELRSMSTADIPGFHGLRETMRAAVDASQDLQGREYLDSAWEAAAQEQLFVLRVSDYGTRGLAGSESVKEPHTPLSTLSRGTGASNRDGGRGGSFGIGSAIGLVASATRTVAYISLRSEESEPVFAATSRLASHYDSDGNLRNGTGYFTDLGCEDDFRYLRGLASLGGFPARTVHGTDVYLLGYLNAESDPKLLSLRDAVATNFLVAIAKGRLVVKGSSPAGQWTLDQESLEGVLEASPDLANRVLPFYNAIQTEPEVGSLRSVGEVSLYVDVSPTYERNLGVQLMRKPKMLVQTVRSGMPVPFAAVFVCENDAGNALLREIEPPTHDHWNENGPRSDGPAVREIRKFIRDTLKQVLPARAAERVDIAGLADFLPREAGGEQAEDSRGQGDPSGAPTHEEAVDVVGAERDLASRRNVPGGPVRIQVEKEGVARPDGEFDARGGRGNDSDPAPHDPQPPTDPTSGDVEPGGRAKIRAGELSFRSFANGDGTTTIRIRALRDVEGDLSIAAYGGGDREVFGVDISGVSNSERAYEYEGSTIRDIALGSGESLTLLVKFSKAARYRLGIA